MKKLMMKFGSFFTATALFMSVTAGAAAAYSDVPDTYWAHDAISKVSDLGITNGYPNGAFAPEGTITRAEFLTMTGRALYSDEIGAAVGAWWTPYYDAALNNNLIKSDETPATAAVMDTNISRYEMARILIRADEGLNGNAETDVNTSAIADYNAIPAEYQSFVAQAYAKGLLTGYKDGRFKGEQNMTRAEATVVVTRLLDTPKEEQPQKPPVWPEDPGLSNDSPAVTDNMVTATIAGKKFPAFGDHPIPDAKLSLYTYPNRMQWTSFGKENLYVCSTTSDKDGNFELTFQMDREELLSYMNKESFQIKTTWIDENGIPRCNFDDPLNQGNGCAIYLDSYHFPELYWGGMNIC